MITERQANIVRDAIAKHYRLYIEPGDEGPQVFMDYGDRHETVVSWETGPHEWAYRIGDGGVNEEIASLLHNEGVSVEKAVKAATERGIEFPAGIGYEPYYSFSISLYEES